MCLSNVILDDSNAVAGVGESRLQEQALEWLVIFWSGEITTNERKAWQHWLDASPEHAKAWQQVQTLEQKLHGMPAALASKALRAEPKSIKRRKLLQAMSVLLIGGVAASVVRETVLWQAYNADYRTATGQQRHIALADGTQISLNTASAIDVQFNTQERRIVLHEGEIYIATAPDPVPVYRPFIVETRHGTARALGTRFNVRQIDSQSRVAVLEGAVEISSKQTSVPFRLDAGQQAMFSDFSIGSVTATNANDAAWLDGSLIVERMRLTDFLMEVARYRPGIIRCDERAAGQIVSGVYPLHDTDLILQSLSQALPIRISYVTRYWVSVSADI